MKKGIRFPGIKVNNKIIIDGHHRYIASKLAQVNLDIDPSHPTSATVITTWNSVAINKTDPDSKAEIERFDLEDAQYCGTELS